MKNDALRQKVAAEHLRRFGEEPQVFAFAPGRMEVLGNHTDYNEGWALSGAIQNGVCLGFSMSKDASAACRVYSMEMQQEASFQAEDIQPGEQNAWVRPLQGVLLLLFERSHLKSCPAFDITIGSDVPPGAGLSSSAALVAAASMVLRRYLSLDISRHDLARICQQAEETFAGVRCGLLDPVTSLFGSNHALLLIDFRTLAVEPAPPSPRVSWLICSPGSQRPLSESEYNNRRAECEAASAFFAKTLEHPVKSLRDVSPEEWTALRQQMDPLLARRARHIIEECARAQDAVAMIRAGRFEDLGRLLYESHQSSAQNFENSSPSQDFVVEQSRQIPGVLGARLTGGGFGGAILALVETARLQEASAALSKACLRQFGAEPFLLNVRLSPSARLLPGTRSSSSYGA